MNNNSYPDAPIAGADMEHDSVDLRRYWRIVAVQKWKIFLIAFLIASATALVVSDIPDRYEASATMLIELKTSNPVHIDDVYDPSSLRREYLRTQYELLESRQIAERVIDQLSLTTHPEFLQENESTLLNRVPGLASLREKIGGNKPVDISEAQLAHLQKQEAIDHFLGHIAIEPIQNSQLVDIKYVSRYPELSAEIANAIAIAYIESYLDVRSEVTGQATSWMNTRLDQLRTKLEASEAALISYREQENLVDLEGVQGLSAQEINGISSQLLDERVRLQSLLSLRRLIRSKGANPASLAELPEIFNHEQIQSAKASELEAMRNVSELQLRYGPKHPKLIAAKDQLASARTNLQSEVQALVNTIQNNYEGALANVKALEQQLEESKGRYQVISRKEGRYGQLRREVELNEELYNTFLTRLEQTNATSDFRMFNARLTDPAVAPIKPSDPQRSLLVMSALAASVLVSALAFVGADVMNQHVRSPEEIEQKLGQRVIGIIPFAEQNRDGNLDLRTYFDKQQFSFNEAVRTLRTSLVMSHLDGQGKVIGITSSIPGEGKSCVAINLAFSLSQIEKVLLIDADMRRPALAREFSLPEDARGLSDLISGSELSTCIYRDEESGLDIMPVGPIPENPQEMLGSPRLVEALSNLVEHYDRIIIDTPPCQVVSDALVVSRLTDAMLYVVKSDAIKVRTVKGGIDRLLQVGAEIDGVVFSQVDTSAKSAHYDDYYGYYGEEYRYDTKAGAQGSA